jgi:hypothetical protein
VLQPLARERRQLRGPPDDRVARRQRLRDHRRVQEQGIIPRPDDPDHPDRPIPDPRRRDEQEPLPPRPEPLVGQRLAAVADGLPDRVERGDDLGHRLAARLADLGPVRFGPGVGRAGELGPEPRQRRAALGTGLAPQSACAPRARTTAAPTAAGDVAGTRPSSAPVAGLRAITTFADAMAMKSVPD